MTAYRHSRFQEVAHLRSVWWLVVAGYFFGVPRGSYKVQWEILESESSAFDNTTFRAVLFDNDVVGCSLIFSISKKKKKGIWMFCCLLTAN